MEDTSKTDPQKSRPSRVPTKPQWFLIIPSGVIFLFLFIIYIWPNDRTAWGEYLTIWPPIIWAGGISLFSILMITLKPRRWALVPVGLGIVFWLAHGEWGSLLRFRGETKSETLNVMTWNISGHHLDDTLFDTVNAVEADLVFLQETPDGIGSPNSEILFEEQGFHWIDAGDCGVLSRWPMEVLETRSVGPWTDPQVVRIETEVQGELILINVRLMLPSLVFVPFGEGWNKLKGDHQQRVNQFQLLNEFVAELKVEYPDAEIILAGDFNSPGRSWTVKQLRSELSDAWQQGGSGWGRTMTADFPIERIDQCWISDGLICEKAFVEQGSFSDHRFVVFEINPVAE